MHNRKVIREDLNEQSGCCKLKGSIFLAISAFLDGLVVSFFMFLVVVVFVNTDIELGLFFFLIISPMILFFIYTLYILIKSKFGNFILEVIAIFYCLLMICFVSVFMIIVIVDYAKDCFHSGYWEC